LKSPTATIKKDARNIGWARFDSLAPISGEAIMRMPTQHPLTKPLGFDEAGVFSAKDFTFEVNSANQTVVIVNPGIHPLTLKIRSIRSLIDTTSVKVSVDPHSQLVSTVGNLIHKSKYSGSLNIVGNAEFAAILFRPILNGLQPPDFPEHPVMHVIERME